MSMKMEDEIKRWTAKRKSAMVVDIIQGKTTVAEASRTYDLSPSEIEQWVDDGKRGMGNALRSNPLWMSKSNMSARSRICNTPTAKQCWSSEPESEASAQAKKVAVPVGRGREIIETIRQGLKEDGYDVSISKLCRWFNIPRRTVYYKPTRSAPKVHPRFAKPIKAMIEEPPLLATAQWHGCLVSIEIRYSASSSSKDGK